MSNDKNPGCFGYLGDEKLPSYVGIRDYFVNHHKDPVLKQPLFHSESIRPGFFRGSHVNMSRGTPPWKDGRTLTRIFVRLP